MNTQLFDSSFRNLQLLWYNSCAMVNPESETRRRGHPLDLWQMFWAEPTLDGLVIAIRQPKPVAMAKPATLPSLRRGVLHLPTLPAEGGSVFPH